MFLGPYEVIDTVGRGGMAVVLRARTKDGREVALKVIQSSRSRDMLARFDRERRLLEALGEAEGFVPLLDAGDSPQGPFLVMPYVPGGTLKKRLENGRLAVDDAVELVRELATAIGRAHALGIVHRDVKPDNILFTLNGRPLIADLGLAKHFTGSDHDSSTARSLSLSNRGELRGTAGYMPKEQMRDAKTVGPTADVFALGAILYECLTGEPAFQGEDFYSLMGRVEKGSYTPVRKLRPDAPRWLARIVDTALAKTPERRYADGTALERALLAEGAEDARRLSHLLAAVLSFVALSATTAALVLLLSGPRRIEGPPAPSGGSVEGARPLLERGADRLAKGDIEGARTDLGRALELEPRLVRAFVLRSKARLLAHDLDGAYDDASRAVELAPGDPDAWIARGETKLARRNTDLGQPDFSKAIELDPDRPLALALRALAKSRQGAHEAARDDADRAVQLGPTVARAWAARGEARAGLGDKRGAIEDLDRAIELDPRDARALGLRGTARAQLVDLAGGLEDLTRATQLDPRDAGVWHDLSVVRRLRSEWDASIEASSRAIELDPRHTYAWGNRAFCRLQKEDRDGALFDYTRAIELDPTDGTSFANRGAARAQTKDLAGAEADFTKAIDLDPRDPDTIQNRGMLRWQRGDLRGAIEDLERYLKMKPNAHDARKTRSIVESLRDKLGERRKS